MIKQWGKLKILLPELGKHKRRNEAPKSGHKVGLDYEGGSWGFKYRKRKS